MRKTFVFKLPSEVKFNNVNDLTNFFRYLRVWFRNDNNNGTLIYFWKLFANNYNYVYNEKNNRIYLFVDKNDSSISYENAKNIRFIFLILPYHNSFQYFGSVDVKNDKNYYFIEFSGNNEKPVVQGFENEEEFNEWYNKGKINLEEQIKSDSVSSEIEKNVPKKENYKTDEEKNKVIKSKEQLKERLEKIKKNKANFENSISKSKKTKDVKISERENLNQKIEIAKKIIIPVITLTIIFAVATLLLFGLFTGGVAPAVLIPLIAKCLIGVLGGISLTGFFTTLLIFCLIKIFRNKRDAKQNEIDDIQKEINPTEQKIEKLQTKKYTIEYEIKKIESDSKKAEDINNGPEMSKNENEKDNGNEYGDNNL